jgi:TonB family protein
MRCRVLLVFWFLVQLTAAASDGKKIPIGKLLDQMVQRSTLTEPSGRPFYLKATITDRNDKRSEFNGTVEEYWLSPTKWRRVIKLRDYSQIHIVNGDKVYEENNGDYFPLHDEMLANEIVDPLPKTAIDLLTKLDLQATEPGSGDGQCMAEKYFDNGGQEARVLLAYNCKNGLLIYLWSPTCCYGVMTDYRKFHDKLIAFGTKDDPINIQIDTLRDIDSADEALFTIAEPTPSSKQITTRYISETEARKYLTEKTDIRWPSVSKKPNTGTITVSTVIGRDGRVKEAWSYGPEDAATKNAALEAVRKWTFHPQTVEGVPAQLVTKLSIPFSAELTGPSASEPDIGPLFERMRAASDLRLDDAPGFHMKASFQSENGAVKGTYEETWLSPKKWRKEVKLNDASVIEVRTEDAFYRTFPGKYAPRVADDLIEVLSFNLPGDNGSDLHTPDWSALDTKLGGVPMLRLSRGYIDPQGKPEAFALQFFIDAKTGFIRGRYHYSTMTIFNDLKPFGQKTVPRNLTSFDVDVNKMVITIDALEPAANVSDDVFKVPGVKPIFFAEAEGDHRFTQPRAVYTVRPSIPGWRGKLNCNVKVDEHGHVREVEVKGTTDESVIRSIRASLMKWEYEPANINGRPAIGFVQVNVE